MGNQKLKSVHSNKLRILEGSHGILKSRTVSGNKKREARYKFEVESQRHQDTTLPDTTVNNEWQDVIMDDATLDDFDCIMNGEEEIPLDQAGSALLDLMTRELREEQKATRKDTRDRRDRILRRNQAFAEQLQDMTDSYFRWSSTIAANGVWNIGIEVSTKPAQGTYQILVVDMLGNQNIHLPLTEGDKGIATALTKNGLIPCAPYSPQLAVTVRTLEFFRLLSLRCPRLAILNFVKTLCDVECSPYKQHLNKQFSICQDVYLQLLGEVASRVQKALGRDSPSWRLRHACPSCTYILKYEKQLLFNMLFTMDGNMSLKRILKRNELMNYTEAANGDIHLHGVINELPDEREVLGDYYITREEVEKWVMDLKNRPGDKAGHNSGTHASQKQKQKATTAEEEEGLAEEETTPCSERWKNMSAQSTSKSWSIFDETGIFVALCRHGFILTLADIVKSGEGSQYALAVVERMLKTFGAKLAGGYDIGCRYKKTLARSSLGPLAKKLKYTSLVGSFHGHAHNRLCQLDYLATYVKGMGLSDLEGAERLFSRSNDLASSTRHSSAFHRQQKIVQFFTHLDETDTYENLSKFLITNYNRAMEILADVPAFEAAREELGINGDEDNIFCQWLAEEKEYLTNRLEEPSEVTDDIDYLDSLIKLLGIKAKIKSREEMYINDSSLTRLRHDHETLATALEKVHDLERKLGYARRWEEGDANWVRVLDLKVHQDYRQCLAKLERLVVQRMFELGRMNRSGTGYKLRQHIARALKRRCQAIRVALKEYNNAAKNLSPPRDVLDWEKVVDYAFLSEFDILADSREDIRERAWARPAARALMDQFFKIERANEEIERLEIEMKRLLTFIRDEEEFLTSMEEHYRSLDPAIAHHIHLKRTRFTRANQQHIVRLEGLFQKRNLVLSAGEAVEHIAGDLLPLMEQSRASDIMAHKIPADNNMSDVLHADFEDEQAEDEMDIELQEGLDLLLSLSEPQSTLYEG